MRPMLFSFVLLLPALVSAGNDWNTPCHSGHCQYHLQNSTAHGATSGVLQIVSLRLYISTKVGLQSSSERNHFRDF